MSTLLFTTISIETESGGRYDPVTGKWIPGIVSEITFEGSVQPMSGREIKSYEYLRQDIGHVKIYSSSQLNVNVRGGDTSGDVVLWQNDRWELVKELKFQNYLIPHYKYFGQYIEA
jgi:hypothetical protein